MMAKAEINIVFRVVEDDEGQKVDQPVFTLMTMVSTPEELEVAIECLPVAMHSQITQLRKDIDKEMVEREGQAGKLAHELIARAKAKE